MLQIKPTSYPLKAERVQDKERESQKNLNFMRSVGFGTVSAMGEGVHYLSIF